MVFHQTQTNGFSGHRTSWKNGILKDTPMDKARILNAQFSSVFTNNSPLNPPPQEDPIPQYPWISQINITTEGIQKLLENLNPNKAMGPDRLHPRFTPVAILQIIFLNPLKMVKYQTTGSEQIWHQFLRKENDNTHQITTQFHSCLCNKLMEHIISKHLLNHLEANIILFDKLHGFRKKHSTDTQLLAFTQDILANLSSGMQTDVININYIILIMDFAKAFDKVPHQKLIQKLEKLESLVL